MAGLSMAFLGPFQVFVDGTPTHGFESNKVRALLSYLAAERQKPHARESLAGFLWPEYPQRSALNSLRSALANLRQAIGDQGAQPPYLLISRETLQFNSASDHLLDIAILDDWESRSPDELQQAVDTTHGRFLEGFFLADSPPFETWLLYKREYYHRRLLEALQHLGAHYENCGDYHHAIACARQALVLEPWLEEAHRRLMRALALDSQRGAALLQYDMCCRILDNELGVEPAAETDALAQNIRDGTLLPQAPARATGFETLSRLPPAPGKPPFKGLNAFEEADAGRFFGREELTAQLVEQVEACLDPQVFSPRFFTLIGASGSGKSSVVRAGLIPALKGKLLPIPALDPIETNSQPPFVGEIRLFTPTARPLEALALCFTTAEDSFSETAELLDALAQNPQTLHLAAARQLKGTVSKNLLLVVDQFEELFTLCHDEVERLAFMKNLLNAAAMPGPVVILIVLRADFYAHCAPYADLREALCQRQQYIGPMDFDGMRRAIMMPAQQDGWTFEPGLVDLFLRDVGEEPGALPLLSHALLATWQRRRGRAMTLAGYQETGGVHGAITQTAETVYQRLSPEQQLIARTIFLRLIELSETPADETRPVLFTRRRAALSELVPRDQSAADVRAVLVQLADARLITTAQESAEIAHEALIQAWSRLRGWIEESVEGLRMQRQLHTAAQEWERLQRDSGVLFRGARLARAAEWTAGNPGALSSQERVFLDASLDAEAAEQAAESARQQRELQAARSLAAEQQRRAEAERQRAEEQLLSAAKLRRRAVWLALAAVGLLLLLIAAINLGLAANRNAHAAREQTQLAISRELAAAAANNLTADPERSVLLALEAVATANTLEARNALHQALPELHILRTIPVQVGGVPGLSYHPDGRHLAAVGVNGEVTVWDASSGKLLMSLPGDPGVLGFDVTYSPDGNLLAASWSEQVMVWDANQGQRLYSLPGMSAGTVRRLDFSPDGQRLAVASQDGQPRVWDLASRTIIQTLSGHNEVAEAIAFSPDGRRLATGDVAGMVKIWEAANGQEILSLEHGGGIHSVTFSPDGTQLAVASDNSRLGIWDSVTGEALFNIPVRSGIYDVDYMADGRRLAATLQDGTTTIWDTATGQQLLHLAGHVSTVISSSPSPDPGQLATSGYDGTIKLWDIDPGHELLTILAHDEPAYDVVYSPDGTQLLSIGFDGTAKLWDAESGLLVRSLPPAEARAPFSSLDLSPDGSRAAIGGWDGSLYLVSMADDQVTVIPAHEQPVIDLVFSPDGQQVATAGWDGTAAVWDIKTGNETARIVSEDENGVRMMISGVAFSPDGSMLFTGGDDDYAHQWDLESGAEIQRFYGDGLDLYGLSVSPDGQFLAMGRQDGAVVLWDIATGEKVHQLPAHAGLVLRLDFNKDGSRLASTGFDSVVKVWDVAAGQELVTLTGINGNVYGVDLSPDDQHLAAAGADGTVRLYTLALDELREMARERVTRDLAVEECRIYLHSETCPAQ